MRKLIALLTLCFFLTGCSSEELQTTQNIINAAATLTPLLLGLGPAYIVAADSAITIADDLLANPNPLGGAKAAGDFGSLVLPTLDANATPEQQQAWKNFVSAIQAFIANYKTPDIAMLQIRGINSWAEHGKAKAKHFKISAKDQKKIDEMRAQIRSIRAKIPKKKA